MTDQPFSPDEWALILGASSGFGAATGLALAEAGLNIFGVHLDRKATMPQAEATVQKIEATGREARFFNLNAADEEKREQALDEMAAALSEGGKPDGLRVLVHSLAFGTLKPYIGNAPEEGVNQPQLEMTVDVMAHTLVYWVQGVVARGMMGEGGRIFAMTSSGGGRVFLTYGPVSAAKAALESHVRQLALELAPVGITVNAIRAGVTDTPALRKIPRHEEMMEIAERRNPMGRLTRPEDVGRAIATLAQGGTYWVTGNVIGVDGGEEIVG